MPYCPPPPLAVAVYEVIGDPPFDEGAVNVMLAEALYATTLVMVGASETVKTTIVTGEEFVAALVPILLVAVTEKV